MCDSDAAGEARTSEPEADSDERGERTRRLVESGYDAPLAYLQPLLDDVRDGPLEGLTTALQRPDARPQPGVGHMTGESGRRRRRQPPPAEGRTDRTMPSSVPT